MRYWTRRFAAMIWEDPTRQIQAMSVLAALLSAGWLLSYRTPTNVGTASAVFYFMDEKTLAAILIGGGVLQLLAVAGPSWQLRAVAATIKLLVWSYVTVCFWLTNPNALAGALLPVFAIAEIWVGYRALHDKEINGTDRRHDGIRG